VPIGFRLAAEMVEGVRATGKGYNARVDKVPRDAPAKGPLQSPCPARRGAIAPAACTVRQRSGAEDGRKRPNACAGVRRMSRGWKAWRTKR